MKKILFLTIMFLSIITACVQAQEYIIEKNIPEKSFVIEYERVNIEINDQVARVTIEESLKNNSKSDIEATLVFPLPEDSGISDFSMTVNGKKMEGKVMDKDEASAIYEEIVRKLRDPAILEHIGQGLFRARIYPIGAGSKTKIEIKYSQILKSDMGLTKFKLPLTGNSTEWPLQELTLGIALKSSKPIKNVYSPTHSLSIKKDGDYKLKAGFEDTHYNRDDDFIMYYGTSEKEMGMNLLTYKDGKNEDGFFLMMVSPGEELSVKDVLPKDIIFILDTSGSMDDENKLKHAQKVLKFCLGNLGKDDRFNLISFNSGVDFYNKGLIEAKKTETDKAKDFIDKLSPLGGTNIDEAIRTALKQFPDSKRPQYIVFLTDGLPTQGETDIETILKNINKENKSGVRLFSFGVGTDVNTYLLDMMAEKNRGYTSYLEAGEEMEVIMSSFFTKINHPVLSDLVLDFGKIKVKDLYPKVLPDIFKGSQLILIGKYTDTGHVAIKLKGDVNGRKKDYIYEKTFPSEDKENSFIAVLWATRKIGYLLNEIRLHGTNKETVDEIVKLSIKYGIVTPYTSYLIQEEVKRTEGANIPVDDEKLYSNLPYVYGKDNNDNAAGAPNVQASTTLDKYKQSETVSNKTDGYTSSPGEVAISVKTIGDKTFYLKESIWTDSLYEGKTNKKIEIKFAGEEYFKLLKDYPELGKYLSLGENIIVIFNGKCYYIKSK